MMNVPRLRFKEFCGDWDVKKIGDVGENIIGLTYSPNNVTEDELFPIVLRSSNIKNDTLDLNDLVRVKEKINERLFVQENDILICTRNGSQRLIGKNVLISNIEAAITFGAFMSVFRSPLNKFIVHLFKTDDYNEQIQMNLGARINQITTKSLNSFKFYFPTIPEQAKIANFLTAIDDKITNLTQKVELLTRYKKGVMQQIFSQQLRFKDDDGLEFPEWEEKSLGEITVSISNGLSSIQNSNKEGYKVTRIETISDKSINLNKVGYVLTDEDISSYKLEIGSILLSNINSISHIGKVVYVDADYNIYHGMNLLRIEINSYFNDSKFIFYQLSSERLKTNFETIANKAVNQASINQTELKKTLLKVPSLPEQTKIANFLTALDDKLTNTKTQLDTMKQYKQGLLQQLFV